MINSIEEYKEYCKKNEIKHVFILSSPIVVFISSLVINSFLIPKNNIIIVPFRNTNTSLINAKSIIQKGSFFDRLIKKIILFSFQGYQLRKKIEKLSNKFVLYCDWDNREVIEILNSKKCLGHAYIEEGQLSFNTFKIYDLKKSRFYQWRRLRRWSKNVTQISRHSDVPSFNECFNKDAFAFFSIYGNAFPAINMYKKIQLTDFSSIKENYKPQLLGKENIGIMCSPRRFRVNEWKESINAFINFLPEKSSIKLHPEFYANKKYLDKFMFIFISNNSKNLEICDKSIIIEAEMLFEKKTLFGPITSLKTYAKLLGSDFIDLSIY